MNIETFREGMSVVKDYSYLNHAATAPLHESVLQELQKISEIQRLGSIHVPFDHLENGFTIVRKPIAQFLNCEEQEIALTTTAAHGIALVLESLDWSNPSKKGIIIDDLEFTTNSFAYQQIQKKFGIKLYVVGNKNGFLDLADFEQLLTSNEIMLVGISHVQFTNGFKINLKKLHDLTKQYGSLLLVDAIQSCGAIAINTSDVDFIAVGSYKWCLGPLGTGFLYVKKELQEYMEPIFVSAASDQNLLDFVHHTFHPHTDARKFQSIFNPNFLAMGKAIELLNEVGISKIEGQIESLTDYLVTKLGTIPRIKVDSNREIEHKSGIVRIVTQDDSIHLGKMVQTLQEKHVIVSYRSKGLRISPHFYNNYDDIDTFLSIFKSLL